MSVYISNLPLYTGNTYNGYIIWNNSGETTTYKTLYQQQLIPGIGIESSVSSNLPQSYAPNDYMYILGKTNAASSGDYSSVWGGRNNKTDNQFGAVVGGYSNTAGYICGVFAGGNNNAQGSCSVILGGESNTLSNTSVFGMLSCYNSTATMGNDNSNAMIAGHSNLFSANGVQGNAMIGGRSNSWYHADSRDPVIGAPRYGLGSMIGGYQNIIAGLVGTASGSHAFPFLVGGKGNALRGEESNDSATSGCSIINSYDSTIIGPTNASGMFECLSSTISGKTQAVMLGTSGRTANADYTTYVENLHTYRTPSTQVQPISSGTTFTCNLNNGAKSQFYITGTSTVNITNVRDGASFMIKTQTDGNHNMTWTATGYTFVFEGGIKDPGNNVTDIFVFEVFGSVIYGNRRHNYS
jgi:hypothetical protein